MRTAASPMLVLAALAVGSCSSSAPSTTPPDARADLGPAVQCAQPNTIGDGEPCACPTDCTYGAACETEMGMGRPYGHCLRFCTLGDDSACSSGTTCRQTLHEDVCLGACTVTADCQYPLECRDGACCAPKGSCEIPCVQHSDCPQGRYCFQSTCVPSCMTDDDCQNHQCNPYSGFCTGIPTQGAGLFESCLRGEDCLSGICFNYVCVASCPVGGLCPENTICGELGDSGVGLCTTACRTSADCVGDFTCETTGSGERLCQPPAFTTDGGQEVCKAPASTVLPGRPCGCDADCASGICGTEEEVGWPGGGCVQAAPCLDASSCGVGYVCSQSMCSIHCQAESDCPKGWLCSSDDNTCHPLCQADAECDSGHCDRWTHRCSDGTELPGKGNLEPCTHDWDCKSDFCNSFLSRCTSECSIALQGCPTGLTCVSASGTSSNGRCYQPCNTNADCSTPGLSCQFLGGKSVCVPD